MATTRGEALADNVALLLQMQEHPQPEMTRLSLQDLALRIKIMKIGSTGIEETLLKALDPPLVANITRAVSALIEVKALTTTEEITPLGRHLAKLPMDVHVGLFLILSCIFGCLDAGLTIAVSPALQVSLTDPVLIMAAPSAGRAELEVAVAYAVRARSRG